MTGGQIILYGLLAVVIALSIRRYLLRRSVTHYSPAEVAQRLKTASPPLLLDVRTDAERSAGAIRGSVHLPLQELPRRAGELSKHKGREIICYCQTGNRSLTAAARLGKLGHTAAHMSGGIVEWNLTQARS